jgi:hypothetical protein
MISSPIKDSKLADEENEKDEKLTELINAKNQIVLRLNSNLTLRTHSKK